MGLRHYENFIFERLKHLEAAVNSKLAFRHLSVRILEGLFAKKYHYNLLFQDYLGTTLRNNLSDRFSYLIRLEKL